MGYDHHPMGPRIIGLCVLSTTRALGLGHGEMVVDGDFEEDDDDDDEEYR
jgi:hypothetical protein